MKSFLFNRLHGWRNGLSGRQVSWVQTLCDNILCNSQIVVLSLGILNLYLKYISKVPRNTDYTQKTLIIKKKV